MFAESDTVMRSLAQNLDLTFTPPKVQKIRSFGTVLVFYYKLLNYEMKHLHRDLHCTLHIQLFGARNNDNNNRFLSVIIN